MGRVVRTTEARTAGTFTLYCPWNVHSASGQESLVGALGEDQRQQEPFQMASPL